jgi:acyl-CoA thioesterase-1
MEDRVVGAASGRAGDCGYGLWRKLVNLAVAAVLAVAFAQPARAATARIVAFGDSLTAGLGLPIEEAFPAKLQVWLREHGLDAEVVNAGVSGDTTAGGLARLDWTIAEPADAVLVEFGANDALRAIDPKVAYKNLDEILSKLEARKTKVLLLGMESPANWGAEYRQSFHAIYPELAERHKVLLYPFFLEGVALDPNLNQTDMLHPNARGVDAIVARVGPYVLRLLNAGQPGGSG